MNNLNYEFFDEFKRLDNICRDIYGNTPDNKLGVTLYLEDMDKKGNQASFKVRNWSSDYARLKNARNLRNELSHSRNSFSCDICSQEDIEFVRTFRLRILNQTDPLSFYRNPTIQQRPSKISQPQRMPQVAHSVRNKAPTGCLGIVATILIIAACVIAFLM